MKSIISVLCYFTLMLPVVLPVTVSATDNSSGAAGYEYHPSAENMIIDGLVYRPLSLAGTLIGAGVFLVTLPFSLIGGNAGEAGQVLVVEPARSTFNRCLGCLPGNFAVHYHPGN